jgi:3-(3-hydroxy-phenyl)propionate hydroxylase
MIKTRVLVAGGGPVGAVAAYRLALAGIDTVLVELLPFPPEDMRASTLHPPTLDMLAELGVLEELELQGLRAPVYHYRNRSTNHVIAFDMGELGDVSAHPYRLQCEQFKLARLLLGKLAELPAGQVLHQHRVLAFDQDADGITAHVETPIAMQRIRAEYLIAADGANSTIRKWTGTKFDGFTYPERFLTLSTRYPIEQHFDGLAGVNYVSDAEEWCVLLRVPDFWRVLVPTDNALADATLLSDAHKDAVFDRLTGNGATVETNHRTLYRVHQRVADSFRHGRVLLAGDAAHLNNPLGGFGMNSGIHDVWNLTTKLRAILLDGAEPEPLLDRYDRQRRAIATSFVQRQTIENKRAMEAGDDTGGAGANERRMAAIAADPAKRRDYLLRQSMYESLAQEAAID